MLVLGSLSAQYAWLAHGVAGALGRGAMALISLVPTLTFLQEREGNQCNGYTTYRLSSDTTF
jgi:hypothetical protein